MSNMLSKIGTIAKNGLIKENPTFVLVLGMCPTLGTTTSALNGMGMGLATLVVLTLSNMVISALSLRTATPQNTACRLPRTAATWMPSPHPPSPRGHLPPRCIRHTMFISQHPAAKPMQ